MGFNERTNDRNEDVDNVVEFEDPNESYFGASSENIVEGNLSLLAGVVKFLVSCYFHEEVVEGNEELFKDEFLELFSFGLKFVEFVFGRFGEGFHFFV